jgi:hypothetical protein
MKTFDEAYFRSGRMSRGGWLSVKPDVIAEINNMVVHGGINTMWIGICSNGESGLRDHWNRKYKALGMMWIVPIYETSSDAFRRNMQQEVIAHFQGSPYVNIENLRSSHGGTAGSPPYFLYVACTRQP